MPLLGPSLHCWDLQEEPATRTKALGQEGFVFVFRHDLGKVLGQGGPHGERLSGDDLSRCTPFRCKLSSKALLWARRLGPSGWAIVEGTVGQSFLEESQRVWWRVGSSTAAARVWISECLSIWLPMLSCLILVGQQTPHPPP